MLYILVSWDFSHLIFNTVFKICSKKCSLSEILVPINVMANVPLTFVGLRFNSYPES